jgi:hypothetical protein
MTTLRIHAATLAAPGLKTLPRGARWAVALLLPLFRALHGRAATPAAPAKAAATNPAVEANRRQREAARVRRYAMELTAVDSRVAAELLAACDRHERGE